MPISVVMPALEMAQETGKLISWLKKEGDHVAKGEPLLEIETDKAVMEVESPGEGLLAGIKAEPGSEIPVGWTIAWIVAPGEAVPADEVHVETGRKTSAAAPALSAAKVVAPSAPGSPEIKVSPKARRLAAEHGVDLAQVKGSGPAGEILASDILTVAAKPTAAKADGLSATARLMAERTTQSWTTVPHFFLVREVDATALNEARAALAPAVEKAHGVNLTISDLLVALVARVLAKHPRMNSSWTGNGVRANSGINISLAMAVEDGVVAPVIHNANDPSFGSIAIVRRDLVERARAGKLRPSDLAGGTFTISNLGMYGVDAFMAIITPPQAAILAVGSIVERVVAVAGKPVVRPIMTMTLSSDHRVVDGARAAEFMRDLAEGIGNPRVWLAS